MSEPLTPDMLFQTAATVLEDAAFVFGEKTDWSSDFGGDVVEACLDFAGPQTGTLRICATRELCTSLAAQLLGVELEEVDPQQSSAEALGELLNIIAGSLVATAYGTHIRCTLSIPRVGERRLLPGGPSTAVSLMMDDGSRLDVEAYVN